MLNSLTGNWWGGGGGGGGTAPSVPTIYAIGAISDTAIRITPGFTAYAATIEVWRSDTQSGTYAKIGTITPPANYFDDTTLTAGQTAWYKLRAVNNVAASAYCTAVSATTLSSLGIERNLWLALTNYLENSSRLNGYVTTFKFDLEAKILNDVNYPILHAWVLKTQEEWTGIPKQKIVKLTFVMHGKVCARDQQTLELAKLEMDERIKDALEAGDMNIEGAGTLNLVGDSVFNNLDSYHAEVFQQAVIWSIRFGAGNR